MMILNFCFPDKLMAGILCVYSYFSESWAMAIFHDRFAEFREDIRDLLVSRPVSFCVSHHAVTLLRTNCILIHLIAE